MMTSKDGSNKVEWQGNAKRLDYSIEALALSVQFALQKAMNENCINQKELAERLGMTPARVSQILGKDSGNLTLRTIGKVADALGEEFEFFSLRDINELKARAKKEDSGRFANVVHISRFTGERTWKDVSPANDTYSVAEVHEFMANAVGQ